jgi:hypothetical protein
MAQYRGKRKKGKRKGSGDGRVHQERFSMATWTQAKDSAFQRNKNRSSVTGAAKRISASLMRMGFPSWSGTHEPWGELSVFVSKANRFPTLIRRRNDLELIFGSAAQ